MAEIVLPLSTDTARGVLIETSASASLSHPARDVEIRMNGDLATTVSLATNAGNRIEVPVPEAVRKGLAERGFLHLEFRFSDCRAPEG